MNLPFSLLDILERLIPGGIFLGVLLVLPPVDVPPELIAASAVKNGLLTAALFVAISYALGVLFNLGIGISASFEDRLYDQRNNVDVKAWGEKGKRLKAAFKDVFAIDHDQDGWRLCYGIVEQSGFGVRIDLFSSLNMFCRSMSVCCLVLAIIYGVAGFAGAQITFGIIAAIAAGAIVLFIRGARTYSLVFAIAIYEAFLTWYDIDRRATASPKRVTVPRAARGSAKSN